MPLDQVYFKAVKAWLEAHGHSSTAASLSEGVVSVSQDDGLSIAEAAAEVLRMKSVLDLSESKFKTTIGVN